MSLHAESSRDATFAWAGYTRGSRGYRRIIVALFCAGVATFTQLYSPQAALPEIGSALRIGPAASALVISAATLGLAVGVIPWSAAADRLGRVPAMSAAMISATVFGLAVPFLPGFWLLLAGRFCEGLLVGGVPAIAIAYLTEEIDRRHTARVAGMYVSGTAIGGLSGRLIAGPLSELVDWRFGVFIVAILSAVACVAFVLAAPRAQGFTPRRGRRPTAAPGGGLPGATPAPIDGLAAKLWHNLRSRRQLALYAQGFALMGGFVAMYNYLTFRLTAPPFSLPTSVTSLIFVAYVAGSWASTTAGALASRRGRLPVLVGSATLMAAGVALTLVDWLPAVLAGLLAATAGFFGAHSIASGWTGAGATAGRAQASSLYNLFYYTGSSVFGWAGGVFFSWIGWAGTAAMIGALALGAIAAAALLLRAPTPGV